MPALKQQACDFLYQIETATLFKEDNNRKIPPKIFKEAMELLHQKGRYSLELLTEEPVLNWIRETYKVFTHAVDIGVKDNKVPDEMLGYLQSDALHFSGYKVNAAMEQANLRLLNEDGTIKPFAKFQQEVLEIDKKYNGSYLQAEYQFAVSASQSAAQWHQIAKDGDKYDLMYKTTGDEDVRQLHAQLEGIVLPPSDSFWDKYFPPLGWRCRCEAIQVLKNKYPTSNSADAEKRGERATTQIGKNGENKLAIFRFNPGKLKLIFPPKHPYYKVDKKTKEVIEKVADVIKFDFNKAIDEAKSKKTVEELMLLELRKAGHETLKVSMSKVDIATAKLYAKEIVKLNNEYNVQGKILKFETNPGKLCYGSVRTNTRSGNMEIKVGENTFAGRVSEVATEKSRCDADKIQKSTLVHEFGHVIHTSNTLKSNVEFLKELRGIKIEYFNFTKTNLKGSVEYNENYLGGYSSDDMDEFMAECFQEYKNYSNPSEFAVKVGKLIDQYFKK